MKVKVLTSISGKGFVYAAGGIYDLPAREAREYIRWGRAELIEEKKKPVQRPVTVQEVKAETRPIRRRKK